MNEFNSILYKISNQDIYLFTELEVLDFTNIKPYKITICSKDYEIDISLDVSDNKFKEKISYLQAFICSEDNFLFCWNIKNLYSYIKGRTGLDFKFNGKIIDLYFFESYLGFNMTKPKTLVEFKDRFKKISKDPLFSKASSVYKSVYVDLIKTVSDIETSPLIHKIKKNKVFSYYEIDGQLNGRLKCSNFFVNCYNPHTLTHEEKSNLNPPIFNGKFISLDYKNMEVSVLQWLSKDEHLLKFLQTNDFYESIWNELIPEVACNSTHRRTCKDIFLPVFYGMGADSLSKKINWPINHVKKIVEKIYKMFPTAIGWIIDQENNIIDNNYAIDNFGRRRKFEESYKIRNFAIQSPASLVCIDRLNKLNESVSGIAKVCMHIHDGYVLYCDNNNLEKSCLKAKKILEETSDFYFDLKLKTVCSVGSHLSDLTQVNF
jgi:hypothetical protein